MFLWAEVNPKDMQMAKKNILLPAAVVSLSRSEDSSSLAHKQSAWRMLTVRPCMASCNPGSPHCSRNTIIRNSRGSRGTTARRNREGKMHRFDNIAFTEQLKGSRSRGKTSSRRIWLKDSLYPAGFSVSNQQHSTIDNTHQLSVGKHFNLHQEQIRRSTVD